MESSKRDFGRIVQYVVTLDTGRFGDWVVVEIPRGSTEKQVLSKLTRTQRKKVKSVKLVTRFQEETA